jgi:hypothetical protein
MAARNSTGQDEFTFVITRAFDAPRDLVWSAFTEPDHMKHGGDPKASRWLPPKWISAPAAAITTGYVRRTAA